jgi:hypothetical protein
MNSGISLKKLSRRLILVSAAILVNATTVLAASGVGDAQMQARDLLSGAAGGSSKILDRPLAIGADRHQQSFPDAQTQARRMILAKSSFGGTSSREFVVLSKANVEAPVAARRIGSAHPDAQESARRMILGTE